jgi:hypothetical protein
MRFTSRNYLYFLWKVRWSYPCNRPWGLTGLWDEAPTFSLDNRLTDGGKVASLTRRPPFPPDPGRFLVLISVRGWVDSRAIMRLEGLGKLKKIHLIGTRTRDLPVCIIVPQPTTLPSNMSDLILEGPYSSTHIPNPHEVLLIYNPQGLHTQKGYASTWTYMLKQLCGHVFIHICLDRN